MDKLAIFSGFRRCLVIKQNSMKSESNRSYSPSTSMIDYTEVEGVQFVDDGWQFPRPVPNCDDPFNLTHNCFDAQSASPITAFSVEIEEQLALLTNGNEELLIETYHQNMKQGLKTKEMSNKMVSTSKQNERPAETKNIPKNFGKQLIKFVKKNQKQVQRILQMSNSSIKYGELNSQLQKRKKKMNKIGDLRDLWLDKTYFGREMRVISTAFLRKYAFNWIFNSRITDRECHLKYRRSLSKLIQKPDQFVNLKLEF